jgi:hypothetical protein
VEGGTPRTAVRSGIRGPRNPVFQPQTAIYPAEAGRLDLAGWRKVEDVRPGLWTGHGAGEDGQSPGTPGVQDAQGVRCPRPAPGGGGRPRDLRRPPNATELGRQRAAREQARGDGEPASQRAHAGLRHPGRAEGEGEPERQGLARQRVRGSELNRWWAPQKASRAPQKAWRAPQKAWRAPQKHGGPRRKHSGAHRKTGRTLRSPSPAATVAVLRAPQPGANGHSTHEHRRPGGGPRGSARAAARRRHRDLASSVPSGHRRWSSTWAGQPYSPTRTATAGGGRNPPNAGPH